MEERDRPLILWVDDTLFDDPVRDVDRITLLRNAAFRRHTLIVSAMPTITWDSRCAPNFDSWFGALPACLRAEVSLLREQTQVIAANAITRGAPLLLVSERKLNSDLPGYQLTLADAVRAVSQPLYILVEHQINDAAFIRRIMPPAWQRKLQEWEKLGKLRYENGGGLSVMNTIVERFTDNNYAKLAFGLPGDVWKLVHFIVFDHDGKCRNKQGENSKKLMNTCTKKGMEKRSHCLERMDQEQYLPLEALRMIIEKRITDKDNYSQLMKKVNKHFNADIETRHFTKLPQIGNDRFFKNEFAKAKEEGFKWNDEWFDRDGSWPEMTRLAERIASSM